MENPETFVFYSIDLKAETTFVFLYLKNTLST